jgi:beta-lactamase class A
MKPYTLRFILVGALVLALQTEADAQIDSARAKIQQIIEHANGRVGVTVIGPERGDTLSFNAHGHFPMQSVYKFPLALAVLNQVDRGKLSLDRKILVRKKDLLPRTWSPLRDKYPDGNVSVPLSELLAFTVSQSDNNGCDILFRLLGGPRTVNRYVHSLGISDIAIVATEAEMHRGWEVQYRNWCSPGAMAELLSRFSRDTILSAKSRDYLWDLMVNTTTAPGRLKGQLPSGTVVAHKTGSSGTNEKGMAAATNDVGIVVLPDGRHCIIVVFVSDSTADEKARDEIIAEIARAVWGSFVGRPGLQR